MKTRVTFLLILVLVLSACASIPRPAEVLQPMTDAVGEAADLLTDDTRVIVRAGDTGPELFRIETISCTPSEYLTCLAGLRSDYESGLSDGLWDGDSGKVLADSVADNALAFMSRIKTMNLMAPGYDVALDEAETARAQSAAAEWYATLTQEDIAALDGLTLETAQNMACEYALAQKLYAYIIRDLDPEISDDEARRVTVRYMKLPFPIEEETEDSSKSTSEDTRKRLVNRVSMIRDEWLAGKTFDELATENADAVEGEWTFGRGEAAAAIEDAAYALAEGELSAPVETEDAVYLLYLISAGNREETRAGKEEIAKRRKLEVFGETYDAFAEKSARHLDDALYDTLKQKKVSITAESFYETLDNYKLIIN